MPRVTRAALRSITLLEESNLAASIPLPRTPQAQRAPLGEIAGNVVEAVAAPDVYSQRSKPEKKAGPKGKRGRVKKAKKLEQEPITEAIIDVIEDDAQSATSSAVNEACQELRRERAGEIHQVAMHDTRPHTPPSPAVNAVRKQSIQDAQSLLDPDMLIQSTAGTPTPKNNEQQHFPAINDSSLCDSMALPKNINEEQGNIEFQGTPEKENSHPGIEQIVMRSPAKPILRIEDSVEAIDAFEEAIEKVGELIPAIAKDHISTAKAKKQRKVVAQPEANNRNTNASRHTIESSASTKSVITRSSSRNPTQKSRAPSLRQANNLSTMKSTTERTSGINGGSVAPSAKATNASPSSPMATVSKPRAVSTKRVSSIHKAPFQPVKSTKPPTRPSFELPGDAVARKLKEQREERLKRGEGEAPKKEAFKARPVRLSSAPAVKETATSRARISMAKLDVRQLIASNNRPLTIVPGVRSGSIPTTNSAKRFSTPSITKKDTTISSHGVNYTASHPPSKEVKMSKNSNELSRGDISVSDMAQQKQRGKEVFNRTRVVQDERERAKREKEEAARKARAEAAERGRIASREWAEKQKLKQMLTIGGNSPKGATVAA